MQKIDSCWNVGIISLIKIMSISGQINSGKVVGYVVSTELNIRATRAGEGHFHNKEVSCVSWLTQKQARAKQLRGIMSVEIHLIIIHKISD